MKCKDCEFFNRNYKESAWRASIWTERWSVCDNKEIFQDDSQGDANKKALFKISDAEGYTAYFIIHENFGCIGFKKNAQKPEIKGDRVNDEQSYWILSFEVLAKELIQSIEKSSQGNNIAKLEELIKRIEKLLSVLMSIMK